MNKIITCALPYANGNLHIGHFFEATCADIKARFLTKQNIPNIFVSGDDCHGAATTIYCEENQLNIEDHLYLQHLNHKKSYAFLNIKFSKFSKTNTKLHQQVVTWSIQNILNTEKKLGLKIFSTQKVLSWFDSSKEQFLPDRYVKGICPHCSAKNQSPEICEVCSKEIEPSKLINPYRKNNYNSVVLKETIHLTLNTNGFYDYLSTNDKIFHSSVIKKILDPSAKTRDFIDISRDSPYYGIPITEFFDKPEFKNLVNQKYYVWFDAPIGYISFAFSFWLENNNIDSPTKNDFEIFIDSLNFEHFIGKDIVYFHSFLWLNLLRLINPNIKVSHINTHGWLTLNEKKFSKSDNDNLDLSKFTQQQIDALRLYFFSKHDGSISDIEFNPKEVIDNYNKTIYSGLANFYARSIKIANNNSIKLDISFKNNNNNLFYSSIPQEYSLLLENCNYKKLFELINFNLSELNSNFQKLELWKSLDIDFIKTTLEKLLSEWFIIFEILELVCPSLSLLKDDVLELRFIHISKKEVFCF